MSSQKLKLALNKGYEAALFLKTMDLKVEVLDKNKAVLSMACNEHTLSAFGSLYGGLIAMAADIAIWNALLAQNSKLKMVTTDLQIRYLERFDKGRARFEANVLRSGQRLLLGECRIFNAQNKLAAHATASFMKA